MTRTTAKSPTSAAGERSVPLEAVLRIEELARRPSRSPDYETENRALAKLVQALADSPDTVLQTLADTALEVLQADSAGLSLLTEQDGGFQRFERRYPELLAATPPAEEALVVPFHVQGKAAGTIWVMAHDARRRFDAEDLRQLESLGRFASAACQAAHFRQADDSRRAALNLMEDAVEARRALETLNEELRQSEGRFRIMADNISQLAWICDKLGNVNWYNRRWLEYTGLSFEEMKDWGWKQCHHPDHVDRVVASVRRSRESGEPWQDTFPLRGKDGEYRWFLSRAVPIRDERGDVRRWFGTNTDITEQRELEDEIRRQAEQLADESRRKDEFLAMLSHELRNPLAPIRSAVHLLRLHEAGSENAIQRQAREIIERQAANLAKLVNDLLEVSRVVSGRIRLDLQSVDLNQVARHAIETVMPLVERRKHELVENLCPGPLWTNADATRIEEVLVNVLNNAVKYTPEGGRIEIWCEAAREASAVQVRVRDDGMGIDGELLPRIFDLFTQADRSLPHSAGGLGIGLSLAHRLVELHGGTIEAHSPPEGSETGSEFIVALPRMAAPQDWERPEPPAAEAPRDPEGVRVLVVDDNIDLVMVLSSTLRKKGYSVQSAYTGPEGLKVAQQWRPDAVLLDIGLPELDGYEVARRLRCDPSLGHSGARMRLIALTGYGRETDVDRSREAGFDAHLVKPYAFDELEKLLALDAPSLSLGKH